MLQAPATATGELEQQFQNLIEQANELKTVNDGIENMELQKLDAMLTEFIDYNKKITTTKIKIKRAPNNEALRETRSST